MALSTAIALLLMSAIGAGLAAGHAAKQITKVEIREWLYPIWFSLTVTFCGFVWMYAGRVIIHSYPWEAQGLPLLLVLLSGILSLPALLWAFWRRNRSWCGYTYFSC